MDSYDVPYVPSIQVMFNLAYNGCKSQDWQQSKSSAGGSSCSYISCTLSGKTIHCAWGWVDQSLTEDYGGSVTFLKNKHIGLAYYLTRQEEEFAIQLQDVHDNTSLSVEERFLSMEERFCKLAEKYELTIPAE